MPDTGAFEVPGALVSTLIALGTSLFPKIVATRSVCWDDEKTSHLSVPEGLELFVPPLAP